MAKINYVEISGLLRGYVVVLNPNDAADLKASRELEYTTTVARFRLKNSPVQMTRTIIPGNTDIENGLVPFENRESAGVIAREITAKAEKIRAGK
jgi:hypothetical protein